MNKTTIQTLIDKVIGKKGLIRVPNWWMRKVLMQMADWVQEGDDAANKKIRKVQEENEKIAMLNNSTKAALVELQKSLHTQRCFVVKTGENASSVYVDNVRKSIPANTQQIVTYTNTFSFKHSSIVYIGLVVADTSSFTDMSYMFNGCSSLTSLNLTGLDTSKVTDMSNMFYSCSGLTSLDLTGFNTSAVTKMSWMFCSCSGLTTLNLSGLDTSKVTDMSDMFYSCRGLTSLILGPNFFKTSKVTSVDFSDSTNWTNDTVVTSLVTNSYDRATAGLSTMTLKLSANTKASLTAEQKAAITAKGYTIA